MPRVLSDAQIDHSSIQQAYASYVYGTSAPWQVALYRIAHTGIPVVNVNNNCSMGYPLGATGLAQCAGLVWQLRGEAEARQAENATVAIKHNIGLGSAALATLYKKVS